VLANFPWALLGAVPALLAMAYVDRLDAKRPEPRQLLRRVAVAGACSAIPVVLIGHGLRLLGPGDPMAEASYTAALYTAFIVAAIPEEAGKMISMLLFSWYRPEFDERMDGIVYGAWAGLGFALIENVAYLVTIPQSLADYVAVFVARAVLAVPGHATWGGIMGYCAAKRRFDGSGPGLLGGYALAVALHGGYDALLFATPVAIDRGHVWVGLGFAGIPIVAYLAPALVIALGASTLRRWAAEAVAADDEAEAYARRRFLRGVSGRWRR